MLKHSLHIKLFNFVIIFIYRYIYLYDVHGIISDIRNNKCNIKSYLIL